MAEDGVVGFKFFSVSGRLNIANERAVERASSHLVNETAYDNAFPHLETAIGAVQEAIFRHEGLDQGGQGFDANGYSEGFDFFL